MVTNLFAVEDKVKDQLEAANPEPIIEEVVSTCLSAGVQSGLYSTVQQQQHLLSSTKITTAVMLSQVWVHCRNAKVL